MKHNYFDWVMIGIYPIIFHLQHMFLMVGIPLYIPMKHHWLWDVPLTLGILSSYPIYLTQTILTHGWLVKNLQCEAPKISKLVYNSNNNGLWYL